MSPTDADDRRDVPAADRVDYLTVVASLVAADHEVADAELVPLEALCRELAITDAERDAVLAFARTPEPARVDASLARLKGNVALRVGLITDAIVIAFADGKVAPGESAEIARLGHALDVHEGQITLIARYVEATILGRGDPSLSRELGDAVAQTPQPGVIRRLYDLIRRR